MQRDLLNETQISKLLVESIELLDITPSMFNEAEDHYKAIGNLLDSNGIDCDISAYGSIATGTVVRPISDDEESYFDFDVLCKRTDAGKQDTAPRDVRMSVEEVLSESGRYADMLECDDTCLTVNYVLNGKEGGFRLDICPCVDNIGDEPRISECETYPVYSDSTVSIATKNSHWLESNPDGLTKWFLDKNARFEAAGRDVRMHDLLEKSGGIYATVEEIPRALDRSDLQRAVQIAKRSRDVYYSSVDGEKPPSCAILVLVAKASDALGDNASPLALLRGFIDGLKPKGRFSEISCDLIEKRGGTWYVGNPVYEGNLLPDDWSDEDMRRFSLWLDALADDLSEMAKGARYSEAAVDRMLGRNKRDKRNAPAAAAIIGGVNSAQRGHKPWLSMM